MRDFSAEVTPVIIARDEEANIGRTLAQLAWAREVVIIDSVSTDRTVAIAKTFPNVRVVERPFDDLASQWNFALAQVKTEWALTLDADYRVTEAFANELRSLQPPDDVVAYEASFQYAVGGRPLRATLYPPRLVVVRARLASHVMDGHAQRLAIAGRTERLREPLIHDDRKSWRRFMARQRTYMRDEAEKIRRGKNLNLPGRIRKLRVVAPLVIVPHILFVKGLILDGLPGLHYAAERLAAELVLSWELLFGRRRKRRRPAVGDAP